MVEAAEEGVRVVFVAIKAKHMQAVMQLGSCYPSIGPYIKHVKRVSQVEVLLLQKVNLGFFQLPLMLNHILEHSYELVLILN